MVPYKNNKEEVPFAHYLALFAKLDPEEASARLQIPFDGQCFTVTLLGKTYTIDYPAYRITCDDPEALALQKRSAQTLLLRYLLEGKALPTAGGWKTFREMPWGEVYVQPFTGRCLSRAAFSFGSRPDVFARGCEALTGRAIPCGDAGYEIPVIGDYAMRIIIWGADEEFGPTAQILYSDNFAVGFSAEDRVVIGDLLISAISQAAHG